MLKKSLLSLAVTASMVGLAGCNISSTTDGAGAKPELQAQQEAVASAYGTYPIFDPVNAKLALGNDLLFAAQAEGGAETTEQDGTMNAGAPGGNPVVAAINDLDGISTVAPIDFAMSGSVDPDTVVADETVFLVRLPNSLDVQPGQAPGAASFAIPTTIDASDNPLKFSDVDQLDLASIAALYSDAAGDPIAEAATNLPLTIALQPQAGDDYDVKVIDVEGTDNVIRVTPLKPLDARSKYIVVITKGVLDADGDAIKGSRDYEFIRSAETSEFISSSLVSVQRLIAGWEGLASSIITQGGADTAKAALLAPGFALTSAFTTTDPHAVLKAMAYPGTWVSTDLVQNDTTIASALTSGATSNVAAAVAAVADNIRQAAGGAVANEGIVPTEREYAFIDDLVLPNPAGGTVTVNQVPLIALNDATSAVGGSKVLVSQGAIELPQYTKTLAADADSIWNASTALATALGKTLPSDLLSSEGKAEADATSYNVTYRFPFPVEQRKAVVPLLFIEPVDSAKATAYAGLGAELAASAALGNCARTSGKWPVTIFQHGITTNRATTLLMGAQLAQSTCSVVVAMDLPHHGIAPRTSDRNGDDIDNSLLGLTVTYNSDTAAVSPFAAAVNVKANDEADSAKDLMGALTERHEGLYLNSNRVATPMAYGTTKAGKSGDFFVRLDNFQRTRDNMRQAVMDLLNLNATLAAIDIDGDGNPDLDVSDVDFVGHSLGAILGTTFVSVNNDAAIQAGNSALNQVQSAVFATPGGSLPKLLQNSVAFRESLIPGLAASGVPEGTSSFESFLTIFQAIVDSGDPINFVSALASGADSETPSLIIEVVGGGAISSTDSDSETTKLPDALIALGGYPSDTVVPNNATGSTYADGSTRIDSADLPLVGTDALADLLGSVHVDASGAESYPITKFKEGTHGTFSSADAYLAFIQMVTQAGSFTLQNGAAISTDSSAVVASDSVLLEVPAL